MRLLYKKRNSSEKACCDLPGQRASAWGGLIENQHIRNAAGTWNRLCGLSPLSGRASTTCWGCSWRAGAWGCSCLSIGRGWGGNICGRVGPHVLVGSSWFAETPSVFSFAGVRIMGERRQKNLRLKWSAGPFVLPGMAKPSRYPIEKLLGSVEVLATHPGDVRERLLAAFIAELHTLSSDDFPLELQEDFIWISHEINKFGAVVSQDGKIIQGSAENTMKRIRKATGTRIARRIFDLYFNICTHQTFQ
jgi:hypothetical protein